jgi:protein-disulfide isomerase
MLAGDLLALHPGKQPARTLVRTMLTFPLCDHQIIVQNLRNTTFLIASALVLSSSAVLGCHAQVPAPAAGTPLSPAIARRVEVLLRQKAQLPPGSIITVGTPTPSELNGYKSISVSVSSDGKSSHPITFLLSDDGKTLAQFNKYDISADPRLALSDAGRPARGGPESAPVIIVGFDDLECPYCARLHATLFPAITQRYGDKVRIVYKDFPLDQHPWAMHAAVDVNCLADQSAPGYWKLVDAIHAHSGEIGQDLTAPAAGAKEADKTLVRATTQLDTLTKTEGSGEKVDMTKLDACIAKQDTKTVDVEKQLAISLNVESTPSLFINGDKIDGALPVEYIFGVIDDALRAENVTPPPPYVAPPPTATPGK